jgi:predicted ATPase
MAHGGQVLISSVTAELARDQLPPDTALLDLGTHRLKDLVQPERVYQLLHASLPAKFPPIWDLDARQHNLPIQPTVLVGRAAELAELRQQLLEPSVRLVTMTGPGGTGKTRLAVQAAAEQLDRFADGVFLVDLAPVTDVRLVASTIGTALGARQERNLTLAETLKRHLRGKRLLLVMDNFEHLLPGTPIVAELLRSCPGLKVLATSRVPLDLYGEHVFVVQPLGLPDAMHALDSLALGRCESVELFFQRARAANVHFQLTTENAPTVAQICTRLEGIPLAIELAAAWMRVLSPEALAARLTDQLRVLVSGPRNLPERQRTVRKTLDWSYGLLNEHEKRLLNRLSVFAGGATLEAIEAVCADRSGASPSILETIARLVDSSMVQRCETLALESRFRLLETVRQYAREGLEKSGEADRICSQHMDYYLAHAETAEMELLGPQLRICLDRLDLEHDNFRASLTWAIKQRRAESGLRLAGALRRFWDIRCHLSEGRNWLDALMALPESAYAQPAVQAKALTAAGNLASTHGDYRRAYEFFGRSLVLRREIRDQKGSASVLVMLGSCARWAGEHARAAEFFEDSLAAFRDIGDESGIGRSLGSLGEVALDRGDFYQAGLLLEQSLALCRKLGDRWMTAYWVSDLALVALGQKDHDRARTLGIEALDLFDEVGDNLGVAISLEVLACAAAASEQSDRAARLVGAAEALREAIGAPLTVAERPKFDQAVASSRTELGDDSFHVARLAGRTLSVDEAAIYARGGSGEGGSAVAVSPH